MRRVRYNVAASLDGFITDAEGRYDWIPNDDTVDFAGLFAKVDTFVMGRKTYETAIASGGPVPWEADTRVYVVSRTLADSNAPNVHIVRDACETVAALRREPGDGEIWLFGGGELFAALLDAGEVDAVEVTIVPVLLGSGTQIVAPLAGRAGLSLTHTHVYPSGMVALHYDVLPRTSA